MKKTAAVDWSAAIQCVHGRLRREKHMVSVFLLTACSVKRRSHKYSSAVVTVILNNTEVGK